LSKERTATDKPTTFQSGFEELIKLKITVTRPI